MRDYTGVSSSRLEVLEERLKSDVISELGEFQGRVLLHTETAAGEVVPVWESVDKSDVATIRETMDDAAGSSTEVDLRFLRIPITSESSPDVRTALDSWTDLLGQTLKLDLQFHDITELLDLCTHTDLETSAFILNDQLGRGRSSTTAVIVLLIQRWMKAGRDHMRDSHHLPTTPSRSKSRPGVSRRKTGAGGAGAAGRQSWQIINSCLRVIRNGLEVKTVSRVKRLRRTVIAGMRGIGQGGMMARTKRCERRRADVRRMSVGEKDGGEVPYGGGLGLDPRLELVGSGRVEKPGYGILPLNRIVARDCWPSQIVDEAIDATAEHFNLRDAIQDFRVKAEEAPDEESKHSYIETGEWVLWTSGSWAWY
jgi:hypothetical protein